MSHYTTIYHLLPGNWRNGIAAFVLSPTNCNRPGVWSYFFVTQSCREGRKGGRLVAVLL